MSLKSWVLDHVHRMNGLVSRVDLPPRDEPPDAPTAAKPPPHASQPVLSRAEHLGPYGSLIRAIRDELEHFIVSQLRLHLAIADRDRFVLTAIGVRCPGADEARERLRQFMHEFKPEQVKRYLMREVIAGLPNAAAIELGQFAGLVEADLHDDEPGDYGDLLAALAGPQPAGEGPDYEVSILGRWSEQDAWPSPSSSFAAESSSRAAPTGTPLTPLAGQRCEFDLEDADGRRRVVLQAVVPGRRYVVGKGEGCDVCVSGTYTSRRHAELWIEQGAWWVGDAGSTNGIRVEAGTRGAPTAVSADGEAPIRLDEGQRLVLSARSDGPAADYPWLALRAGHSAAARLTPIAVASPKTPLTAILSNAPVVEATFTITTTQASGTSSTELMPSWLPVSVGRSRSQTLVIDRRHEGVSGHHLDIVELDDAAAQVLVHGDNGVSVDGVRYAAGARLRWPFGQRMVLGAPAPGETACTLVLQRMGE